MINITVKKASPAELRPKPAPGSPLGFGKILTDHLFVMDYEDGKGWFNPRIEPYRPFLMDPATQVLHYAEANQKRALSHVQPLTLYRVHDFMIVDETTQKNLELEHSLFDREKRGSLFWALDETVTGMGSGKLKQWLNYPLIDLREIEGRLESVAELKEKQLARKRVRESLQGIQDIERLASRIFLGHANARDLVGLKQSLQLLPRLKEAG